ncbi:hypothetical protein D1AOALGA4SA_9638 [Olavius algarvensis Delta 1 endosymbiont]|nr:hypothetical protein D1AOALGA4SA_9638 [Olavius algarvensis Delta 1 endosymbiont]
MEYWRISLRDKYIKEFTFNREIRNKNVTGRMPHVELKKLTVR